MELNNVYSDYFQKSRIFMYPILGFERGGSVTPMNTFVSWENRIKPEDGKLICLYHLRNDSEYRSFEKTKLLGHKLFDDFYELESETPKAVYIFDLKNFREDWDTFLAGKYSDLTPATKAKIRNFHGAETANYAHIESYIYPSRFFSLYAKLLNVEEQVLREVGQLCAVPDIDRETLRAQVKKMHIMDQTY